ncbi:MAG: CDP-glycerol glycerophosphotransferase family protein [Polyangiaceae bacterium]|nr:CDP-glycerol glycerophosphotransferase family protein [Polyangiaceae bacterium]
MNIDDALSSLLEQNPEDGWSEFLSLYAQTDDQGALCLQLGDRLHASNHYELARRVFQLARERGSASSDTLRRIADTFAAEGRTEAAQRLFGQAARGRTEKADSPPTSDIPAVEAPTPPPSPELVRLEGRLDRALEEIADLQRQQCALEAETQRPRQDTPLGERKLKVVFFTQAVCSWLVWDSVYQVMSKDARFDARVVVVPFLQAGAPSDDVSGYLLNRDIPFTQHTHYDVASERPDVVIYQNPYDETRPEQFRTAHVRRVCHRIVYSPYGLELTGGPEYTKNNYENPFICAAWRIFARSESHKRMYGQHCPRGNDHVRVTGSPQLDALLSFSRKEVDPAVFNFAKGRPILLYNPQFGAAADGSGASTFLKWHKTILDVIESRNDIALILRPHPLLFGSLLSGGLMRQGELDRLMERIAASESVLLDSTGDYRNAMWAADAILSDLSSLLLEFAVLDKPVAYLHNPTGPGLNEDGPIVESFYRPTTGGDIADYVHMIAQGLDPMQAQRTATVKQYIFEPELDTASLIRDEIFSAVSGGI